ncbi:universal stress protein [Litorivivens sp.]|uniref:universal stress protein n=1 Tax=Litorivivens sp. TaxID=2020868 RepID=UPI00356375F5
MKGYSNILVAVDLSDEAEQVLEEAAALAARYQAEISVIHVAHALTFYGDFPYYASPLDSELYNQEEIRKILFKELDKLAEPFDITRGSIDVRFGYPPDEIVAKAKHDHADLIVVGSHGRHGIRLLLGSTANSVLHHAECNVLAVRIVES